THEVDALVIKGPKGEKVYTLVGADHPYRVLVETMNEGAATLADDDMIVYCNQRFARLLGVSLEQLLGTPMTDWVAPSDRPWFEELIEQAETGTAKGEMNLQAPGGTPIPVQLSLSSMTLEEMQGICIVITDLTEQKRNAEMVKAERLARAILEQATEAIIVCDPEGRIMRASHKAYELVGKTLQGQSFFDVFSLKLDSDEPLPWQVRSRCRGKAAVASLLDWCQAQRHFQQDMTLIHPDGQVRFLLLSAAPLYNDDQAMLGCVITLTDISTRKRIEESLRESELRFRQFAENSDDVLWISNPRENKLLYVSPAYERLWGRSCESLYANFEDWIEAIHPEDRDRVRSCFYRLVEQGKYDEQYRVVRPDGSIHWIRDRGFPIKDDSGRIYRVAGIAEDITERKQSEEALCEADRRKDDFLAVLAHELRNPLAPIRNAVTILRHQGTPELRLQWCRDVIDRQVDQMARLLDDLLDVSRITRGKLELRKERVELAAVVRQALETSRPPIEAAGHELTIAMPAEPLFLEADSIRLAQVFSNLLNNAAKYTEHGGHIWLTAEQIGSEARISVKDTGIGIPTDQLLHIFEPFMQMRASLGRSQGGLGIGLTLVQQLVRMHGGRIEARSAGAGQGSEFIVYLPLAIEAPATAASTDSTGQESAPTRLRLLVADDNKDAATSLSLLLQMTGHEVAIAYDGLEAVDKAATFRPDVVLLDLGMPKLDGYEAARRIRAQPWGKEMILIAVTGWGQDGDRRRTQEAGFDYHLVKPVDPDVLEKLLAELTTAGAGSG
ncbi:MAG TPA: PAS domain S-box protein, partial [Candidatus Competibacteraceae bacterium]|nr:PAS domain S-box protein [Candidatus Competibacteraceae bacterium]